VIARYVQTQTVDEPLAQSRSGLISFYLADGLGSVTSLTNTLGAVVNTYTYDSFGRLTASSGSVTNPLQYTGAEFDSETGLRYYRARHLDPTIGRFTSEDPLRFEGDGPNLYEYVGNEPIRNFDPTGLSHRCWGLCGGKCCNGSKQDEWWMDDGVWKKLPAGKCTGTFDDCDGMTCGGGFYTVSDLNVNMYGLIPVCRTPGNNCLLMRYRWTPNNQGPKANSPEQRGAPSNSPPPGYGWVN